ncbi:MAG: FtsX-like permease family protein [Peptococcaceae bacterium]|nr:FtsX-like permease family protein [Peptococcaceae bacterium]
MLANNNQAIINKLAKNSVRTNKKQYAILFVTILLSALMLFCVFTIGMAYLDASRLQNTRLNGAEYDIATMNGFTSEQLHTLQQNDAVQSVGMESYAGSIKGSEFDDTVDVGLLWRDDVFWDTLMAPARTALKGHYPQHKNELMVTKALLKACGNENLSVGDRLTLTYENNTGIHTDDFVISGLWDGYGDTTVGFVSKAFYDETGYDLKNDGILCIKLNHNYVLPTTLQTIEKSLDFSDRQIFAPTSYIENSLKLLFGICGLALVICLSAYLLIYNILYLSVSGKIRYYGLLQSLGMTKKQLVRFITKQMLLIGVSGIAIGNLLGIVLCMTCVPYVLGVFGISTENTALQFNPLILMVSIVVTGLSILLGMRKPIQIATRVTPVEATKHRAAISKGKGYKKKKGAFFWRMAFDQLGKDKKKTLVVLLSLATSLSVFYCLTTIISSQGERTVLPNYWNADFVIQNQTQTTEDINSLQPAITDTFVKDIEGLDGIKDVHLVEGVPIVLPYVSDGFSEMWIRNYIDRTPYLSAEEVIADYRANPSAYYGMLIGIDDEQFEYVNQSLNHPVDKQDFLDGKICLVQYEGSEIPAEYLNQTVPFNFQGTSYEITVGAVSYDTQYSGRDIGASLIVSQAYLDSLTAAPTTLDMYIYYDKTYDEALEKKLTALVDNSPYSNDLYTESQYENMKTIQESQGNMMAIGTTIALLLLLVGVLNYANTIASSIQNRKRTFAVMEGIGMSRKQLQQLLMREGVLYAAFSVLMTLTIGTAITYACFQSMNYMAVPFKIPVLPLIGAMILVLLICTLTPVLSYKKLAGNRAIVERLRDYE